MSNEITVRPLQLSDIFKVAPIARKLKNKVNLDGFKVDHDNLDDEGNPIVSALSQAEYGNKIAMELLSNIDLIEDEVYGLFSSLTGKTPEEVSKFNLTQMIQVITGLMGDKEFPVFLNQAKALA